MKQDIFVRYTPAGHKLRTFTIFHLQSHDPDRKLFDVRLAWGTSNPDTIEALIKKYGLREMVRIVPNNERYYHNFTADEVSARLRVWKGSCTRFGLTGEDAFQEG